MTPLEHYQQDLQREEFFHDAAQARAVEHLDDLYHRLLAVDSRRRAGLLFRLKKRQPQKGLYMWGGVGRGKTYLMDVFFESLPFKQKQRMHFHRFMQYVHREMRLRQGQKNPLVGIASDLAEQAHVLCFDEFFVTDITDAMILGGLMESLFAQGVTLVATSNITPGDLYRDGLQRTRFLPAINLLQRHTQTLNVDGGTDYRLRLLEQAELYRCPLGNVADAFLQERFNTLETEHGDVRENIELSVEGRPIAVRKISDDVAWFDYQALCNGPRSQTDYIEIAREYHTVLLGDVERMGATTDDRARRFVNMVDEFYDRGVKLIVTAEVPIEDLYSGGRLQFEFQRTCSRLLEMQSHEYLARPHKP